MQILIWTLTATVLTLLCSYVPCAQTQAQMNRDACDTGISSLLTEASIKCAGAWC